MVACTLETFSFIIVSSVVKDLEFCSPYTSRPSLDGIVSVVHEKAVSMIEGMLVVFQVSFQSRFDVGQFIRKEVTVRGVFNLISNFP